MNLILTKTNNKLPYHASKSIIRMVQPIIVVDLNFRLNRNHKMGQGAPLSKTHVDVISQWSSKQDLISETGCPYSTKLWTPRL